MAAVTPDAGLAPDLEGSLIRRPGPKRLPFISTTVSNTDTYAYHTVPYKVAWEPVNGTDQVAATHSGTTITFAAPAGNHSGYLLVWET